MKCQFIPRILAIFLLTGIVFAGQPLGRGTASTQKTSVNDVFAPMDINNIFTYYRNNGDGSLNPYTGNGGFEIISASRGITMFEEGFVWGGFHKKVLKVGGSTYNQGLQAGRISVAGTATTAPVASDPNDPKNRLYRVRPDVNPRAPFAEVESLLNQEIALYAKYDNTTTSRTLYDNYLADWYDWPADQGAPFDDVNHNGKYDPNVDIPGVPGAGQTIWYVANDLDASRTQHLYGSDPIGIEMQKTIWAYNLSGALGNTIFQKNKLINKSGIQIDSMFVGQWADCDDGGGLGYKDDFTGCDTVLSLGFTYNGTNSDGFFKAKPPAVGIDFVQGPIVRGAAGDRAIFNNAYRYGYKNLPMTAFNFFINSNNLYRDPTLADPKGTMEMYNLMNGLIVSTGAPNISPITGEPTKFALSGDPVTGKGWIDGTIAGPDDRRQILCSGPFTMAAGDTQEVVVAEIAAQAYDRLSSVSLLKYFDRLAQSAYDQLFDLPKPPAQPAVVTAALDKQVVLDWSGAASVQAVETPAPKGYAFQGYNVYQLPEAGSDNPKLLATFDLKDEYGTIVDTVYYAPLGAVVYVPVQNGNNGGVQRYFNATEDYINNKPLVNGQTYYFAVTAYNLKTSSQTTPVTLENRPIAIAVTPQAPVPNDHVNANVGDLITPTHTAGIADATFGFKVANPRTITGHTYEVTITVPDTIVTVSVDNTITPPETTITKHPDTKWQVTDKTTGAIVVSPSTSFAISNDNPVVDGIQFGMKASPYWVAGQEVAYLAYAKAGGDINMVKTMTASNWVGVNGGLAYFGGGFDLAANFRGSTLAPIQVSKKVEIRFSHTTTQKAYEYLRLSATGTAKYNGFKEQPFTVWDVTNAANPRQLDFAFLEQSGGRFQNDVWGPGTASGDREYFYINDETYTATEKASYAGTVETSLASRPMLYAGWFTLRDSTMLPYADGDIFKIVPTHFLSTSDVWSFSTADLAPTVITAVKPVDVVTTYDLGQNYPNPFNPSTTITYQLPATAHVSLKVFDLLGREVATLVDGVKHAGKYTTQWNAQKNSSGVYFYRIQAGSFVMTKKLMLLR